MSGGAEPLARKRRFSERQAPWLVFGLCSALGTAAAAVAIDQGVLAEYEGFSAILRGYTLTGLLLGVSSTVCCFFTFVYSLRKRPLQEHWPVARGTLMGWLWAHVYFGALSVVLALAHAGYGAISLEPSTGKLLLLVLVLLMGSGVLWRAVYAALPRKAAREVGNYSALASRARAEECRVEIDKIAAGRSSDFQRATAWLLAASPSHAELAQAAASLPPEEQASFHEVAALSAERRTALARERQQLGYLRALSRSRILHVPLGLAFLLFLPWHVVAALELPATLVRPGAISGVHFGAFERSERCAECHEAIYAEWKTSMHAHAMKSPLMIAQTNAAVAQVLEGAASPDPKEICVNCHGPVGALLTREATLPLAGGTFADAELLNEGVSCVVCHQWDGKPAGGRAGLFAWQEDLARGRTYYGPFADAVGNAFHKSEASSVFQRPEQLCKNCHMVQLDKNGDGKHERGVDLVLQTLFDEWEAAVQGGGPTCLDCHMPVSGRRRAAESALIPLEQDRDAPDRVVRDHSFVAVDYPLDDPALRALTRSRREALLRGAVRLGLVPGSLDTSSGVAFEVEVRNTGTGHHFPGGFAFVRQAWLEVTVLDGRGQRLAASGVLARSSDDLCDGTLLGEPNGDLRPLLSGCEQVDAQLVNFQQRLVDRVEIPRDASGRNLTGPRGENLLIPAESAKEVIVQHLSGGPVPRLRPSTQKTIAPIPFGSAASFQYRFAVGPAPKKLVVRLLFRTVSPYFLRALGRTAPDLGLERYIDAIEITEMARLEQSLP